MNNVFTVFIIQYTLCIIHVIMVTIMHCLYYSVYFMHYTCNYGDNHALFILFSILYALYM